MKGQSEIRRGETAIVDASSPGQWSPARKTANGRLSSASATDLALKAKGGDVLAFSTLYRQYRGALEHFFHSAGRGHHEAEDLAQQTMLSAFEHLQSWSDRPGVPFSAWLYRIAQNQLISYLRREARLEMLDPATLGRLLDGEQARAAAQGEAASDPRQAELVRWISRLSDSQCEALRLRYVLGLGHKEIGLRMDRSPEAVRKLLARTLLSLEQRLRVTRR